MITAEAYEEAIQRGLDRAPSPMDPEALADLAVILGHSPTDEISGIPPHSRGNGPTVSLGAANGTPGSPGQQERERASGADRV